MNKNEAAFKQLNPAHQAYLLVQHSITSATECIERAQKSLEKADARELKFCLIEAIQRLGDALKSA